MNNARHDHDLELDEDVANVLPTTPLVLAEDGQKLPSSFVTWASIRGPRPPSSSTRSESSLRASLNVQAPLTALVCGAQTSGKSHTLNQLLSTFNESGSSMFSRNDQDSTLLLYTGITSTTPKHNTSSTSSAPVSLDQETVSTFTTVLTTSPAILQHPSASNGVQMFPLQLSASDISTDMVLEILNLPETHPRYMDVMDAMNLSEEWTYSAFKSGIQPMSHSGLGKWILHQLAPLDALIVSDERSKSNARLHLRRNGLVIVDLSHLAKHVAVAASVASFIMALFLEPPRSGLRTIALDGFEKILADKQASSPLKASLVDLSRSSSKLGLRMILSTQDPSIVPIEYIASSSLVVIHTLWSPAWMQALALHSIPVDHQLCAEVAKLQAGQVIVFCPRAIRLKSSAAPNAEGAALRVGWDHLRLQLSIVTPPRSASVPIQHANTGAGDAPPTPISSKTLDASASAFSPSASLPSVPVQPVSHSTTGGLLGFPQVPSDTHSPFLEDEPLISFADDADNKVTHEADSSSSMLGPSSSAEHESPGDDWLASAVHNYRSPLSRGQHMSSDDLPRTQEKGKQRQQYAGAVDSDSVDDVVPGSPATSWASNKASFENWAEEDPLKRFQPLLDALTNSKTPVHTDILFYNLRSLPNVPIHAEGFRAYLKEAATLGLVYMDDMDVFLSPPIPAQELETGEETIILNKATFKNTSHLSSAQPSASTQGHGARNVTPSLPARFVPLLQLLRAQRAEGRARTTCSYIATRLRKEKPAWMGKNWTLAKYLTAAEERNLLAVKWNDPKDADADGWVTLSQFGRSFPISDPDTSANPTSTHPISTGTATTTPSGSMPRGSRKAKPLTERQRFEPLRNLFADGRTTLNGGMVGEIRKLYPGIIPLGAGEVKAYIDAAIVARVVQFADDRKEWLTLVS